MHIPDTFRRGGGGFSLVELVMTLVIFGILISLAAPAMGGWIRRTQMNSALEQLTRDVFYARMLAVREGRRVEMRFATDGNGCVTIYRLVVTSNPERQAKIVDLRDEARGVCLGLNDATTLVFDSRGMASADRTFTARVGAMADSMRMSFSGQVYRWDEG